MAFWSAKTLPRPFDEKQAGEVLAELGKNARAGADTVLLKRLKVGENKALVLALAGNSPYLGQLILKNPVFLKQLFREDPEKIVAGLIEKTADKAGTCHKEADFKKLLRAFKGRIALLTAAADIAGYWDLGAATAALSKAADLCLQLSLAHILRAQMAKGVFPWPEGKPELAGPDLARKSGFVVLSLGKLGEGSLNYSSDVDLVLLYDENKIALEDEFPKAFFTKVSQRLVGLMSERTADGYCFRVDLRLRPDPGTTPPAVSFSAAEVYYQSLAETWERAAMIKARISAGDRSVGEDFLTRIRHFVWRRHMDFAAVQDIHAIKDRIFRHYGYREITLMGHDLKVGEGGIRSIEFFCQIHQLIAGGRNPSLRIPSTLGALPALAQAGIIDHATCRQLMDAYVFLRTIEHRLQMIADEQTQKLPETDAGMAHLATFLGFDDPQEFKTRLLGTLSIVKRHYDRLPGIDEDKSVPAFLKDREALERRLLTWGFSETSAVIIEKWAKAPYKSLKNPRARALFANLLPEVLENFSRSADPDKTLAHFDDFLSKLPSGVQILSLFKNNPWIFQVIGKILVMAPNLSEELSRRPDLFDFVLDPTFFDTPPGKDILEATLNTVLAAAESHEEVLEAARRWLNEMRFQTGVHLLEGLTSTAEAGRHRANLAEVMLSQLLPYVESDFAKRNGTINGGELAVIALGSFGGRELTSGSDLDLVLLYDAPPGATAKSGKGLPASQYFIRLGQHFLTSLSAMMGSGKLYEVDLRLRPSGRWGPLVVTLDSFLDYQKSSAWTVEHMALTRARAVVGSPAFKARIEDGIKDILTMKRNPRALKKSMAEVREKYFSEHGSKNIYNVRHARGGLIDAEYVLQFHLLTQGHRHPEIFALPFDGALEKLVALKALGAAEAKTLAEAHGVFLEIHGLLRLCRKTIPEGKDIPLPLSALLGSAAGLPGGNVLEKRIVFLQKEVSALYRRTFSG